MPTERKRKATTHEDTDGHLVMFKHCLDCNREVPTTWRKDGWHCIQSRHRVYLCPQCSQKRNLPQPDLNHWRPPKSDKEEEKK